MDAEALVVNDLENVGLEIRESKVRNRGVVVFAAMPFGATKSLVRIKGPSITKTSPSGLKTDP